MPTGKTKKSKVVAPRNPKLIRSSEEHQKLCPSAYLAEMGLSTQDRLNQTYEMRIPEVIELLDMSEMTHQKNTVVDIEEPLFQPFPSEIVFQNFEAHKIYKIPLQLRNNDQVARLVKVVQAESPYFSIICPPDVGHKVAPGMDIIFYVQFNPDQKKDYIHEVMCITEREKFIVPVKAIGARGILDFPDEIHFGICPVKNSSSKTLLIRNIGNATSKFNLVVDKPYSVSPDSGILEIGTSIQVDVSFEPYRTGGHTSNLVVQYDTGEEIYVTLHGDAIDINVRIDKNNVRLDNTYITSISKKSISIVNRSEHLVHFSWKTFATACEEEHHKQLYCKDINEKAQLETDEFMDECLADPMLREKYSLITRSFKNKIMMADENQLLFHDTNIILQPMEGDIWPNSSIEIDVIFKPDEAKNYSSVVYCDVSGREARLPLRIRGEGIGPVFDFSYDTLDIENVFINSKHCYEVVIANKGDIDAKFDNVPSKSLFGRQFIFNPSTGVVKAGSYQAIQIYFSSSNLGEFAETFDWTVEGSSKKFQFNVRGSVIGPTFHFDEQNFQFNTISYGFTYEKHCKLVNTSLIPMTFNLHVPTDGTETKSADIAKSFLNGTLNDLQLVSNDTTKEFEISPSHGTLMALSEVDVQISFTPLSLCKYETVLSVDVEGVGKEILSLPISAKVVVPVIHAETPILDFGRCFLNFPYERMIELSNTTKYAAKYELVAQVNDEFNNLTYTSPLNRGTIESNSSFQVPLNVAVHTLGQIDTFVYFTIFGSQTDSLQIHLQAIGEGPVVHIDRNAIDFGVIPVLKNISHQLKLSNESSIPAKVQCEMVRPKTLFKVSPSSFHIPPESYININVTANVNDNTRFQDKLAICVEDSQVHTIHLCTQGTGTTIVTDPPFGPTVNIGHLFTNNVFEQSFRFYNSGRRAQQIYCLTDGFPTNKIRRKQEHNTDDMKYRNLPPPVDPATPIFKLIPDRLTLAPGKYQDVILQGFSKNPQKVKEKIICQAIVGNSSGKEKIIVADIIAEFIQPLLEFSTRNLSFTVIKHPESELEKEVKLVTVTNSSKLPLRALLKLEQPFQFAPSLSTNNTSTMNNTSTLELSIPVEEKVEIFIEFDPSFVSNNISQSVESKLNVMFYDHPNTDEVALKGEVYYPNLDFEMTKIDFGSVLNDTEHKKLVTVTNNSPLDVVYVWSFVQHDICFEGKDIDEGIGKELSDISSSDEDQSSKPIINNLATNAPSEINDVSSSNQIRRPKTSHTNGVVQEITPYSSDMKRPSTAPPSCLLTSSKTSRSALITWSQLTAPPLNVGIEEVFDVLPLYGTLKPCESQQFQFTFYGHTHIMADAVAICSIKGGPDYEINLSGHASLVQYEFNEKEIDFGKQLYDQKASYVVKLKNNGKVLFDFTALNMNKGDSNVVEKLSVTPAEGIVNAGETVDLTVMYTPGIPDHFSANFEIRVAHFKPELFTIKGYGVFPRITLSLPKDEELPIYQTLYKQAKENLLTQQNIEESDLFDWDIQGEIDRLQIQRFAVDKIESMLSIVTSAESKLTKKSVKSRPSLISYVLDFGHVVMGTVLSQVCQLTNAGYYSVSFYADHRQLHGTGFYVDLDRVKGLPGFPHNEYLEFQVVFNPASANLSLGPVEVILPIKLVSGPIVNLCLKAYVTMPDISLSMEQIEFDSVICGQCKVVTIQLSNVTKVRCDWEYECPQEKNEIDKHVPMHLRKKMKAEKLKPKIFEIMPPSGTLQPGQKINIQVKFMPVEETSYIDKLFINLKESTLRHSILCKGIGKEPHIEFDQSLLTFGPILPYTGREYLTVKVVNPCPYPIEFYSLEFDKQYLAEEKIVRSMKGFDEFNLLLLPPRIPGEALPKQLLEYYEEWNKPLDLPHEISVPIFNSSESCINTMNSSNDTEGSKDVSNETSTETQLKDEDSKELSVGDLEVTPVSAAIASYLGIDLSVEGKAARNRRGICIIVNGAPLSGKTATAHDLASRYQCIVITINDVVLHALQYGTTSAAIRVRELCSAACKIAKASAEVAAQASIESKIESSNADVASLANTLTTGLNVGTAAAKLTGRKYSAMPPKLPRSSQQQQATISPPVVSSPSHVSKKLDVQCTLNGFSNEEYYSCVLPEELLVELMAERLQFSDCHCGVVFDGLTSMFSTSIAAMANVVLRAINNRKYIYAVTLKLSYDKLKEINANNTIEQERIKYLTEQNEWLRLEEMSEDEYNELDEDEREAIDQKRLNLKKQKLKKKKFLRQQQEKERKEKELLEEKRLEEEKTNKKNRKAATSGGGKIKEKKSNDKVPLRDSTVKPTNEQNIRADTSMLSERSASVEDTDKKRGGKTARQKSGMIKEHHITPIDENREPEETEEEKALRSRFRPYEESIKDVLALFEAWDRTIGAIAIPEVEKNETEVDIPIAPSMSVSKKSERKKIEKEKLKEISESPVASITSIDNMDSSIADETDKAKDGIGIPNVVVDTMNPQQSLFEDVTALDILPHVGMVMDGMGVGPSGPPIPPDAIFSVMPYPVERNPPAINETGHHYSFVNENEVLLKEDKSKSDVHEIEKPIDKKESRKHKGKQVERQPSAAKSKGGRQSSLATNKADSPPPLFNSPDKESSLIDGGSKSSLNLVKHRWVVPPSESIDIKVMFTSQQVGQFDQTLNFELVGTRRRYQLFCRGICSFPNISREPRIVFPNRKKFRKPDEIVQKKYILNNETFEFGPLLAGKNRERYREGRYPENMERITICNTSPMTAEISFAYLNDANATTFLLEPTTMLLQPKENQILLIWAYPKTPGFYEDNIVCCIKENPEPVQFKVSTHGVRPELELDRKLIQFDRVLLHRKETRTMYLRNSTLLPVCWKVNGMENLGDDFSLTIDHGIIAAMSEFGLQLHFRAIKPVNIKKIIRLEVSDASNVMGLAHAENISVQAEAYDVALDMSFPKGADGGLDFGTMRVGEEAKQTCTLKNKGRYEIAYHFTFENVEKSPPNTQELFTITPNRGSLIPSDRPTQVQVTYKSKSEMLIKDIPLLKCQIIEPNMGENGEIIASIPVKISAISVYSKYSIYPREDINFGAVLINTKKTRSFIIENKSEFDFRYTISKLCLALPPGGAIGGGKGKGNGLLRTISRQGSLYSGKSQQIQPQRSRRDSVKGTGDVLSVGGGGGGGGSNVHSNNIRLQLGIFTIFPANGVVLPGGSATITVDMFSEIAVVGDEEFVIDISERSPTDSPNGIEYRLFGEVCIPSIISFPHGISTIFEEHRIVKNLNVFRYHSHELKPGTGVYGEDESKFTFYNVIVGYKVQARFKIANPNKVPCDILINLKPISNKPVHRINEIYEVEPSRTSIQAHSSIYATVTFQPPSMQSYSCIFEAMVEGLSSSAPKGRNLTFEIQGDGNLPRIIVTKPLATNKKGNPIIVFNKLLIGRSQLQPVIFKNEGSLPCKVNMKLTDPNQSFSICQQLDENEEMKEIDKVYLHTTTSKPASTSINVAINETCSFLVEFNPKSNGKLASDLSLSVADNPFEDTTVQLIGEGYHEEVTIENIQASYMLQEQNDLPIDSHNLTVPSSNQLRFGDCRINIPKCLTFTITNHSANEACRFFWENQSNLSFSPSCGHLLPNCAKDVTVTYNSDGADKLVGVNVPCKIEKIILGSESLKVHNWDNRRRVIRWVDESSSISQNDLKLNKENSMTSKLNKKKIIEIEAEPAHTVIPGRSIDIDLVVYANCNYAKYSCKTDRIYFKDTFMFQTRVFNFTMKNEGEVSLDYSWNIKPGIYRPRTAIEDDSPPESVKSGKNSRKGVHSSASKSIPSGGKGRTLPKPPKTMPPLSDVTREESEIVVSRLGGSRVAHTNDGRPSSVMALAYDASGLGETVFQGTDTIPFTIEPAEGSIAPGKEANFTIRFSPLEVIDFNAILTANITNLDPGLERPCTALHGNSVLPWCHFELEESNYIQERRNPELRGPNGAAPGTTLDSRTKVVEFLACGINAKLTKKFYILNPTDTSYIFQWIQESSNGAAHGSMNSSFACLTPKGIINAGKKSEIIFEYLVESLEVVETFWRFLIVDQNVSVPFILVAHGSEPNISFDRSHINFKQLLLGHKKTEVLYLLNDEDTSFPFHFEENSRHSAGHLAKLLVEPMKGVVPPKSKLPVNILFEAGHEAEVNFNLCCRIKKKTSPLTVNVKAEGFAINIDLMCEDSSGNRVKLSPKGFNVINFNNVEVNEKAVRQLSLENNGRFNLDFSCNVTSSNKNSDDDDNKKAKLYPVTMTPESGTILANTKRRCQIAFCPPQKVSLKNCNIAVKILNGPLYNLQIVGSGCPPSLHFSMTSHDFGPCFIYRSGLSIQKTKLIITNKDNKEISVECSYVNTGYLEVSPIPNVFQPGEQREVEIRFFPRELIQYSERIGFEINGLSMTYVEITGRGADMRVEVENPSDRKLNIGAISINEKMKRSVRIVNRSLAHIEFSVTVTPFAANLQNVLSILPNTLIQLKPKASCDVMVMFQPKARIAKFTEEIIMECAGVSQTLFTVTGACQGFEIKLDTNAIPFGSVTLGSSSLRKLIMVNSGDVGSSFAWNVDNFLPNFNISPIKGYISPGMEVPFEIDFSPKAVSQDIRCDDIRCSLEGCRSLKMVLTGSCVPQLPMKEIIHFTTHVRNRDTKSVTLHNKSNQLWNLHPIIDGEYWSAADVFTVEPLQSKNYELIYRPLTMTQDLKKHTGSVFFALPDGSGLLYNLLGNADPPKPVSNIQRDVPCKMAYTEMLNVTNWLRKPQRFRVTMELIKPEKPDPATTFKGLDYIDIPGLSKKEYKVNFYAHKEGSFSCKVTFKNEQSGEYQFYYVTFRVSSPGSIGTIDLTTPVRQSVSHVVTITNPLLNLVNFQSNCNITDINLPPQLSVPPQSEGSCTFEYIPLKAGTVTGRLVLQSVELGVYIYDLNLIATLAAPERPVHFITTLGTSQVLSCKFINYSRTRVEYMSKVDSAEFLVDKTVNAASAASGGIEVSVDVTFEPSHLGDSQANLTVSSVIGGEYTFPLFGHCLPPKPQGPYTIKAGTSTQIPFKNIFSQTTQFSFHIDNPSFTTKTGETIRAKKTHNLVVNFDGNQGDSKAVRMGRLVITCARSAGTGTNLSWTFYLKGVTL